MQRLRAAQHGSQGLNRGANDVVLGLLRGQRRARSLGVKTQHPGARIIRLETFTHNLRPHAASGTEFGDFFQELVVRIKEEGKPGGKLVNIQTSPDRGVHISNAIRQGERYFLSCGTSCLAHVIAGDRDRVPIRKMIAGVGEHIGDDAHGLLRRIDVGAPRNVFLQNIVLYCA